MGLIQRLRKAGYDEEMYLFIEIRNTIAEIKNKAISPTRGEKILILSDVLKALDSEETTKGNPLKKGSNPKTTLTIISAEKIDTPEKFAKCLFGDKKTTKEKGK